MSLRTTVYLNDPSSPGCGPHQFVTAATREEAMTSSPRLASSPATIIASLSRPPYAINCRYCHHGVCVVLVYSSRPVFRRPIYSCFKDLRCCSSSDPFRSARSTAQPGRLSVSPQTPWRSWAYGIRRATALPRCDDEKQQARVDSSFAQRNTLLDVVERAWVIMYKCRSWVQCSLSFRSP